MKKLSDLFSARRKAVPARTYDPARERPVIRASICTGERVAGFRDIKTGVFHDVMLIQSQKDLDDFLALYGLDDIPTEY